MDILNEIHLALSKYKAQAGTQAGSMRVTVSLKNYNDVVSKLSAMRMYGSNNIMGIQISGVPINFDHGVSHDEIRIQALGSMPMIYHIGQTPVGPIQQKRAVNTPWQPNTLQTPWGNPSIGFIWDDDAITEITSKPEDKEAKQKYCYHEWKAYKGFTEDYDFCVKCDKKKDK